MILSVLETSAEDLSEQFKAKALSVNALAIYYCSGIRSTCGDSRLRLLVVRSLLSLSFLLLGCDDHSFEPGPL